MKRIIDLIYSQSTENWNARCSEAFEELFGSPGGRYPEKARKEVSLRAPDSMGDSGVLFASLLHPSNPPSGAYGGMSFVLFPVTDTYCGIAMGIGTQGLSPDEDILGRPGHSRKVQAICSWINKQYGHGEMIAWSKQDPIRTDIDIPGNINQLFNEYESVFKRYGKVLYSFFKPTNDREATTKIVTALLDLMFEERGIIPLTSHKEDYQRIKESYTSYLFPEINQGEIINLIKRRKFIILEGPPGTGKTRLATEILKAEYDNNGVSIQFHPNTTYENFIGGLYPEKQDNSLGFSFVTKKGDLMEAVSEAKLNPSKKFLLHIDEINRADLSKVLGEAIFLFEHKSEYQRKVKLAYEFSAPIGNELIIPDNFHILGTMNTADRSIAIVDVAVRRRFGFVKLWPQMSVVKSLACKSMIEAFERTVSIFIEYANEDAFNLVPGHSYFLESNEELAGNSLKVDLVPLLEEYLAQGYVTSFADAIRAHIQWINSMNSAS